VVVAVLDSGVLKAHPDLSGALLPGLDLVDGDTDPEEPRVSPLQTFHGSHVAGIIAAPWQGIGMAGASQARILPVRILDERGSGRESDLILGLRWAAGIPVEGLPPNPNPARVVNLSLAGEGPCGAAIQQAIDEVVARGVLVVAAAGNFAGQVQDYFPANCRGVLAVGAVGPDGALAPYSNRGAPILAPGGNGTGEGQGVLGPTWDASLGYAYRFLQGTSQAAPHVSAAAALLFSRGAGPEGVAAALIAGASPSLDGRLLRADRAMVALEGGGVALSGGGSLSLLPGEEGTVEVEVLSAYPVRVGVQVEGPLSAYLSPNPAQGRALLRVRADERAGPGAYRVRLFAGEASLEVPVEVSARSERVLVYLCPPSGECRKAVLPKEGGPFRFTAERGVAHRLLAFLDLDGDGLLDPGEPRTEQEVYPPAQGLSLVL
jgi:serine protease